MNCSLSRMHLHSYVDGELSPTALLEFESHISQCEACKVDIEFTRRLKQSIRTQLTAGPATPESVKSGIERALAQESVQTRRGAGNRSTVAAAGLAAAAALVAFLAAERGGEFVGASQAGMAMPVFGDIVKRHQDHAPTEIETQEPERAARWVGDKLGMRIDTVAFGQSRVRLVGARLSHVGAHRAAKLYYSVGERRLTAVVFESTPELRGYLQREPTIRHERIGGRDVTYYSVQGYTVPIIEHDGLIYGFTADLEREELLQLVASARLP